jgi:soluble lytic murein transglycosylase
MRFRIRSILTLLCSISTLQVSAQAQFAQPEGLSSASDQAVLAMYQAYRGSDHAGMAALLPQTRGSLLEPWAAYWEVRGRLDQAQAEEVEQFMKRWAGSYQEDRLRNDWLLKLGELRDWSNFKRLYPALRMRDDTEIQCYALLVERLDRGTAVADAVASRWLAGRKTDDGCTTAAALLLSTGELQPATVWRKARLAIESKRPQLAREALDLLSPALGQQIQLIHNKPLHYLIGAAGTTPADPELVLLALIRLADLDADAAAAQMSGRQAQTLNAEQRAWAWGQIGKQSTLALSASALDYFKQVAVAALGDDHLAWRTRAALRAQDWLQVRLSIEAMSEPARQEPSWVYWHARAQLAQAQDEAQRQQALRSFGRIAGSSGFYEMLALEALGRPITLPLAPSPLTATEMAEAERNPGLQRALRAIALGLRSEGVREWHYTIALAQPGGLSDRALLAAAQLACQREIWDRCINTSERTRHVIDVAQRYPLPLRELVLPRSQAIGLDPAYVYGLIRQESRFVVQARSGAGASGLMQVMPGTARWTADKIGMLDFKPSQINERSTNVTIGTAYLKLVLDDFDGSMAMASAAYNAGPGRPRNWRAPGGSGPTLEGAIWAETIPFGETRDYVKKVLANTTLYAAILHESQQSLLARLGTVGPRPSSEPAPADLP